ncbi:MAG: ABC transporter ATP-binding protein [Candidatus Thorarchaeota archaeon]
MSSDNNLPIIEFKEVSKNYRDVTALRGVTFTINKGDIFGYIGPNGAGKTTTLKILVGLIRDYSGEVKISGQILHEMSDWGRLIGYMPQDVGFQEWRTVDHALMTFGLLSGMKKAELLERIPEVLELVGLSEARKRKIKHLSGGMEQKLKLAQALLHDPSILILDEPMSGLDPTSRWQMKNIIRQLANREITIIFSSHILSDVEDIATTFGILNQGLVVKIGKPKELQKELVGGEGVELNGENLLEKQDLFKSLSFVASISPVNNSPDRIHLYFSKDTNINQALKELIDFLSKNDLVVRNLNYLKPSLEQVYLKYVMEGAGV